MVTPSALASTTYYKIGDNVTFAWNYTSLSVTPSKIDVLVTCSANSATYTLTNNASFASTGSVVWDTFPDETGTAPLLTETYALLVHDAAKDVSAVASAGHLGSYNQFQFGMYIKQSYTPRTGKEENWSLRFSKTPANTIYYRMEVRGVQRGHVRYRAASTQVHVRHGHYHSPLLHLVRWRIRGNALKHFRHSEISAS